MNRHPKRKQAVDSLIEDAKTLWKWAPRVFWSALALFLLYAVLGDTLIYLAPSWTYGYSLKYDVDESNVTIYLRPHNCEWGSAPLGDKHCHYNAELSRVRTGVSKEDGTIPLVSYDDGKTWSINTDHIKPSVFVSWARVDE